MGLVGIFASLAIVLIFMIALLRALDILLERKTKEQLRQSITDFWITTAELAFVEQLHLALRKRYAQTSAHRWSFIKLFWLLCAVVAISITANSWRETVDPKPGYQQMVKYDFETRYRIRCAHLYPEKAKEVCDPEKGADHPELVAYKVKQSEFQRFIEQSGQRALKISSLFSVLLSILFLGLPLTVALILSFNLTLWILSQITRSRLRLLFLVCLDFFIALLMPPILTSFCVLLFLGFSILVSGSIAGYGTFSTANWFSFTAATAVLYVNISYIVPALSFLIASSLPFNWAIILSALIVAVGSIWLAVNRVFEFSADTAKVLNLDFSTDVLDAIINWAIFTDLLFSIFFLAPSLLLVLANRSDRARSAFLNLVMWVGDHPRGPLIGIAEFLGLFTAIFKRSEK